MKRVAVAILIVFLIIFASLPVSYGKRNVSYVGNFDFSSNQVKTVIVTFTSDPVLQYAKSMAFKIRKLFDADALKSYDLSISKSHSAFLESFKNLGAELNCSYSYTINGVSISIRESDIPKIASYGGVDSIYEDTPAYLERATMTNVIQSTVVNKMKDSSGNYITGKGIIVGVVDTGVDYTDKELGGGGFPNSKVIGGYDFADNDADPKDTDGHGTHVAGIIAGSTYGVAPDAKIMAYKVFSGTNNSTSTSLIIQGIDQAVKDKCNVINISIGTPGGSASGNDPESIAVRNAVNSGVIVVAAAGNKGAPSPAINYPMSSPASVKEAICVGATDDSTMGIINVASNQIDGSYPGESPKFVEGNYNMVYCGLGNVDDFKGKDVKGKIALIQRGEIYFGDKDINAKNAGASGVIVFNNVSGIPKIQLVSQNDSTFKDFIPFLFVSYTDGLLLKQNLSLSVSIQNKYGLGLIADFSSQGPTTDFFLKPDIVAPGVNITSTLPGNQLGAMSGTSMASPVVAGVAALLKQVRPTISADDAKALMMNSADVLTNPYSGLPFSPLMQGAGRIDALSLINNQYMLKPSSFMFGNGDLSKSVTFTLTNLSSSQKSFYTSYQLASNDKISVSLPFTVSVPANGTTTFVVNFSATKSVAEAYGYIYLNASQTSSIHIPFVYLSEPISNPTLLSNVQLSSQTVTPETALNLKFTVGMGEDMSDDNSTFKSNVAEEVKISIYNSQGNLIDTVFDQAPIYTGDYSVNRPLLDSAGNARYQNGTYYYKVEYVNATVDDNAKLVLPTTVVASSSGQFAVANGPQNSLTTVTQNGFTLLLNKGEDFWVDLLLSSDKQEGSLSLIFKFDPSLFNAVACVPGKNLGSDVSFSSDIGNGLIAVTVTSDNLAVPSKGVIASVHLQTIENGCGYLGVSYVQSTSLSSFALPGVYYDVSDYSRYFDLNNDRVINNLDLSILNASYLKKQGESGFNKACDLNFDGIVNSVDFFILSEHFGEKYP
ncbi:MAG: S8 family serine peptidase [Caldisericaceae bacterium]